ncbi:hypothetical protein D3C72_818070 [compost metagenome]
MPGEADVPGLVPAEGADDGARLGAEDAGSFGDDEVTGDAVPGEGLFLGAVTPGWTWARTTASTGAVSGAAGQPAIATTASNKATDGTDGRGTGASWARGDALHIPGERGFRRHVRNRFT